MAFSQSNQSNFRVATRNLKSFINSKIGHYLLGEAIGKGGFATVYKATNVSTKKEFAVKVIDLERMNEKQIEGLSREINIHGRLNHPNIPKLYEVITKNEKIYLVMELAEGIELFEYVRLNGPLQEKQAVKVFEQVCVTVKYLHNEGIAHRDIKAENIMINSSFEVKIFDFGLSKTFQIGQNVFNHTFCGSPSYCSPEIIKNKTYSTELIDIWCLGVTLFVMLEAFLPFDDVNEEARKENICNFKWHATKKSSDEAIKVYNLIFVPFEERIKIGQLLCCDLFAKYYFGKGNKLDAKKTMWSATENSYKNMCKFNGWLNKTESKIEADIEIEKFEAFVKSPILVAKLDNQKRIKTDEAKNYLCSQKRYSRTSSEISNKNNLKGEKRTKVFSVHSHDIKILHLKKTFKNKIPTSLPDQEEIIESIKSSKNKIVTNSFRVNKNNFRKLSSKS